MTYFTPDFHWTRCQVNHLMRQNKTLGMQVVLFPDIHPKLFHRGTIEIESSPTSQQGQKHWLPISRRKVDIFTQNVAELFLFYLDNIRCLGHGNHQFLELCVYIVKPLRISG